MKLGNRMAVLDRKMFGDVRRLINQVEVALHNLTGKRVPATPATNETVNLGPKFGTLKGKTIFISGGSRGIGLEIAKRCARDGANVAIAAKTTELHPKLPGTIYTACEEISKAGGKGLPIIMDVRSDEAVEKAIEKAVQEFGGIDILINNASAIHLADVENTPIKKFDLMFDINVRGTFLLTQMALPYLMKAANPHILTLAPPVNLDLKWFHGHGPYTTSKYAMSMLATTFAQELAAYGIASNCLWPKTPIMTAAVMNLKGGNIFANMSRKPEIMADAAYEILVREAKKLTGHHFIDDAVLLSCGVNDFEQYSVKPGSKLMADLFL